MVAFSYAQESFAAGIVSPALAHKSSSSVYPTGLKDCVNAIISREGSIIRRPSCRFVRRANAASRLLPFTSVAGVEWVIEIGADKKARFYTQQGFLENPKNSAKAQDSNALSLSGLPYAESELPQVQSVAVGNDLYLLHKNHTPRRLRYSSTANPETTAPWTLSIPSFTGLMSGQKPSCGAAYGQRLVFSGFENKPGRILFSRTPDSSGNLRLTDFTKGTDADYALDFTTARGEAIYWLLEQDSGMLFGSHSGMYILSSRSSDQALSGTNATVKQRSPLPIGVVPPQPVDQAFFVAHNNLRDILQAQYSFELAGIQTESQTVNAGHLFNSPIQDMAFSQSEGLLWVLIDQKLISMSFWRETGVKAFSRHEMGGGGVVRSMAVINGAVGDQLWLCVERNGNFTIEFMQFNEVLNMPHHLDSVVYENDSIHVTSTYHLYHDDVPNDVQAVHDFGEYSYEAGTEGWIGEDALIRGSRHVATGYGFETRIEFLPPRPSYNNARNSARKTLLSEVEIAVTQSSGFDIVCYNEDGGGTRLQAYSGVHAGGVGAADFINDTVYHANLPSDYNTRAHIGIITTSARPLNIHQVLIRGELE